MALYPEDAHHENKARDILDGMSEYRLHRTGIKMADTSPQERGGQGVVVVGTFTQPGAPKLLLPDEFEELLPKVLEKLLCDESNELQFEALKKIIPCKYDELVSEAFKIFHSEGLTKDRTGRLKKLVFERFQELLFGKKVAVKKLEWPRNDAGESIKFFKSFVNEISLMASLSHPNVIKFLGFVEDIKKGDAWIILPWEANGNVREFLRSGEWDIPERISLIQDTAKGLEFLHTRDPPICHGDLKSLNILVNSSYQAVITDFGSARIRWKAESEIQSETPRQVLGGDAAPVGLTPPQVKFSPSTSELTLTGPGFSLRWTAPEVLDNGMQDLPSDMWAMGWICWEVVTGRLPFEEVDRGEAIIKRTITGKLPPIREDNQLSHVLMLCSLMLDFCWLSEPGRRIDASVFRQKVDILPSSTPSDSASEGQKVRSVGLLLELGRLYELQSDNVKAEAKYRSAIDIATQTKDDLAKANAFQYLGRIYGGNSNFGEAESSYNQARELYSCLGNSLGTANALGGLGEIYRMQSKYREAENAFISAHETHSRIGNDLGTGNALVGLGITHLAQSRSEDAEKAFREAYELHSRIGNDLGAASALDGLGQFHHTQSQYEDALAAFNKACETHSRIGNDLGTGNALVGLGYTYLAQSKKLEAESAFMEACKIYSLIGNDPGVASALDGLEQLCPAQSQNQEVGSAFNEPRAIHPITSDNLSTGNAPHGLGTIISDQCTYNEAEPSGRRVLALHDLANEGHGSDRLGLRNLYPTQHRYLEIEEAVTKALAIATNIAHQHCQAAASQLMAEILRSESKIGDSMDAQIQAEADYAQIGNYAAQAQTLHEIGDIQTRQSMYTEAEESFHLARAIFLSIDNANGAATSLRMLGMLYINQGRYAEAEECFIESRLVSASTGDENGEAQVLDGLTFVYALQSKFGDAKATCTEACRIYTSIGRPLSEICAYGLVTLQVMEENPI